MNPIHSAFASDPCVYLSLDKLFQALDQMDNQERYELLETVILEVLVNAPTHFPDHETAWQQLYALLKEKCLQLHANSILNQQFVAYSIISRVLAWWNINSDERHIREVIQIQKAEIQRIEAAFADRQMTRQQREKLVGECQERINNLPSDVPLRREKYNRFCDTIVKPFLTRRVEGD